MVLHAATTTLFRIFVCKRGGGLYFRLDIIHVKGLSKHTLNTYFSGMKIDPKNTRFCMSFPKFVTDYDQKHPPLFFFFFFFSILYVFAPLNDVRAYIAWS